MMINPLNRRDLLKTLGVGLMMAGLKGTAMGQETSNDFFVYIGTYASTRSKGIHVYRLDYQTGDLKMQHEIDGVENPSFLAIDPARRYLYAVNEISRYEGQNAGSISAFSIDAQTGGLTFLNKQSSLGAAPCYVTVDKTSRWALLANYTGGNAAVLPILEDGRLGPASDVVQHEGSSVNRQRQNEPHAHSIVLDASNRFAYVSDLGLDKVMIYQFDRENGKLVPNDPPFAQVKGGSGPRHFTFHPNDLFAYGIQEISSEIVAFRFDNTNGSLTEIQTVSTLPGDFSGQNSCADVHVSPNGHFLYGSNRGHNSVAIFKIDSQSGKLEFIGHQSTGGQTPRNFGIDPTGKFLLAANQDTNNVAVFQIDPETGTLQATGKEIQISKPVCVKFTYFQLPSATGSSY